MKGKTQLEKEILNMVNALYEQGTGSHDTILGKRVECSSMWNSEFKVGGRIYNGVDETVASILEISDTQLNAIKKIGEWQYTKYQEHGIFQDSFLYFTYIDQDIIDPFLSECTRIDVDPVEYYGEDFLRSDFVIETNKLENIGDSELIAKTIIDRIQAKIQDIN